MSKKILLVILIVIAGLFFAGLIIGAGAVFGIRLADKYLVKNRESGQVAGEQQTEKLYTKEAPFLGSPKAEVVIVEFADFQCPFCRRFAQNILPLLKQEYISSGKAKFVYQDYAFLGIESELAAQAAKCAGKQNRFWEYHDALYGQQRGENQGAFAPENLKRLAADLNLEINEFNQCLESGAARSAVLEEGQIALNNGVEATPTLFINGQKIEGLLDYEIYKQIIDQNLNKN